MTPKPHSVPDAVQAFPWRRSRSRRLQRATKLPVQPFGAQRQQPAAIRESQLMRCAERLQRLPPLGG